jgi:uncharacterized membrane protein YdfJ with MMPL/SSD domain
MLGRVAAFVIRSPRRVVAITAAVSVAVLAGVVPLASTLSTGSFENGGWESVAAREQVERATGVRIDSPVVAMVERRADGGARRLRARAERVRRVLARDPAVATARPLPTRADDRRYVIAQFRPISDSELQDAVARIRDRFEGSEDVVLGGSAVGDAQLNETVGEDLARAEMFAFPILLVMLFFIFRGVVPALLPLGVGMLTICGSALILGAINQAFPLSVFCLNLVAGLGLGLSVDYSLLMLARYREEAAAVGFGPEAVARTIRATGRTIVFTAVTIGAAMAALLVFPLQFLYSVGIAGMLVSAISAALAICVLPAVLLLAGERVGRPSELDRERAQGFWFRRARGVMRRPWVSALAVVAVLLALGLPITGMQYTVADASALPEEASARTVLDELERDLAPGALTPARVVLTAPRTAEAEVARAARSIAEAAAAPQARPQYLGHSTWALDVPISGSPSSEGAQRIVERIRTAPTGVPIEVGGDTALFLDLKAGITDSLPLAILLLALPTMVALFLLTGSVLLPLKAVLMNVLSIGASIGLIVLVFQDGVLGVGGGSTGIEVYQPVILAALAFGLSTDYAMFLLSRIKGFHDRGDGDVDAVSYGLQRTGRLVTAAALLFCVAIGSVATSQLAFIQQLGIGAAVAVLIDATIIRGVLVPALMALLGRWNWWAPRSLRALHERFEGSVSEEDAAYETTVLVR